MSKIQVMIVDDSLMVRKVLGDIIKSDPKLELCGTASNGRLALMKLPTMKPDVITLDVMMPDMDGLETLKQIMAKYPAKVIMVSALTTEGADATLKALEIGAVDFVPKPTAENVQLEELEEQLLSKIHAISKSKWTSQTVITAPEKRPEPVRPTVNRIIAEGKPAKKIVAIGISTGGPAALKTVFSQKIDPHAGYLIVQHMPATFTPQLAERLDSLSEIKIKQAVHQETVNAGFAYIAPGDQHMEVLPNNDGSLRIHLSNKEKVSGHRPSADALFYSLERANLAHRCVAVIMTGMGRDGASGIGLLKKKGAMTLAQDQSSSVVFGMNKEAINEGAISKVVTLYDIAKEINAALANIKI